MTAPKVSRIPAAPKPRKRASVAAREAEAEDGFVTVEQCGLTMKIPVAGKVPLAAYIAFVEGDELGGTRLLLGEKQWAAFLAKKPTVGDFAEIGRQLGDLSGN